MGRLNSFLVEGWMPERELYIIFFIAECNKENLAPGPV